MFLRAAVKFAWLLILLTPGLAFSQTINTAVGNAINDGRPALRTPLVQPWGLAFDPAGNLQIADTGSFVVRRISAADSLSTVLAGGGEEYDDAIPIPGRRAGLNFPAYLAMDAGTIYFSDFNNFRVRKITPSGLVTTVAGTGVYGYSGDGGKATLAEISKPTGLALDRSRNFLYFADSRNSVVRRINLNTGLIQTVAGNGIKGAGGDNGPGTQASLNNPWGLALDAAGNLFIADTNEHVVRKLSTNGIITTEVPTTAGLNNPTALAFDPAGRLHIADFFNYRVVRSAPGGTLTVVAGGAGGSMRPQENVLATSTFVFFPTGLAFDSLGNLYISEQGWNLVRRVDAVSGRVSTFAGTTDVLDGGPAISAPLAFPFGIAIGGGSLFIADTDHHRIRRVDPDGTIRTVVGNGSAASAPDGAFGASASVDSPLMISLDGRGGLLFTEAFSVVRRVDLVTGRLSTVAGSAYNRGFSGENGPAVNARLSVPFAVVADSAGNIYISDRDNHCIRRVNPEGIIRAVAGICGQRGYSGDGGPALQARLNTPIGLAFDLNGNLLISDYNNSLVRRLNMATGIIERIAGKPQSFNYTGDGGPPLEAELGAPTALAVDRDGTIYISDDGLSVVRTIRGNVISTLAGLGFPGFYGDGKEAAFARLNSPEGIALDGSGNVYIADSLNNRIRRVSLGTATPPVLTVTPSSLTFRVPQGAAPPAPESLQIRNAGSGLLTWTAEASTSSGGTWLRLSDNAGSAPAGLPVRVNPSGLAAGTYQGTIDIRSPQASNTSVSVPVTLTVEAVIEPRLSLSTQFLSFETVQGGAPPPSQILSITNSGSGDLNWNTQVLTSRGGDWLSVSPVSGTARAGADASTALVSVNPGAQLSPGLYLGIVTVTNLHNSTSTPVAVSLLVAAPASRILLHPSSFVFTTVQGSNSVPSQSFRVLNVGQGVMQWQVQTFLPQGDWLRVTPSSGSSDAANPAGSPTVTLTVDPSSLSPGVHGGLLLIQAPGARNNPQFATVTIRVLPPGSPPVSQVLPGGLIFTGTAGGSPLVQEAIVQTTGGSPLNFTVGGRTQDSAGWLTVSPTSGALVSSSERTRVRVQVVPGDLPAGVYRGAVTFSFSDGTVREVAVAAILSAPDPAVRAAADISPKDHCAPTRQVVVSSLLPNNFALPTGWPVPMTVRIYDDCGSAVTNSTVAVSFTNGDPPIVLLNLRDGQYTATWVPTRSTPGTASNVQVSVRALNPQLPETTIQLTGAVGLDNTNPVINDNAIVNGASFATFRPISPGGIFTLFGSNLAPGGECFGGHCAGSLPLPETLGGVSVKIGGLDAPLFYAGPNQINAQVPGELTDVTSADVVVTARGIVSASRTVQLDGTQPGIFIASGTQGAVLNQDFSPNSPASPARRGSVLQIFATGLGPTNPSIPAGQPAPSSPPFAAVTNPVTVTLGGVNAPVEFQAAAPGFVGLYQINVQVPSGIAPGSAVPLKIIQNGIESNAVTVAVN